MSKENATFPGSSDSGITVNREYKSSVFKAYFSIRENCLALYNAVNGTNYGDDADIRIETLENSVFLNIYNDVSFVICGTINLYEHQSTLNPNMALRDLFYISHLYKAIAMRSDNDLYGSKLIKLPNPSFMVFYNGRDDAPEEEILKLSDSFEHRSDNPELELTVRFVNINFGHNNDLMNGCTPLRDYSILTKRVRDNLDSGLGIRDAATKAVDSCIEDNIMRDYLVKEKAGVIAMHVLDYNEEKHARSLREEGMEKGRAECRITDLAQMLSRGGTEADLRRFLDATDEEIALAKEKATKLSVKNS
ncbi:MAG: hypothetical protein ILP13_02335 [Lachnospiraceae bacterium]|nr:hypothetical protein [Lachnospiraceae bacterium]